MKTAVIKFLDSLGITSIPGIIIKEHSPVETIITCNGTDNQVHKLLELYPNESVVTDYKEFDTASFNGNWLYGQLVINIIPEGEIKKSDKEMAELMAEMDAGNPATFNTHLEELANSKPKQTTLQKIHAFEKKTGID